MLSNRAETKVSKFSGQLQGSQPLARQKTLASMSIEIIKAEPGIKVQQTVLAR